MYATFFTRFEHNFLRKKIENYSYNLMGPGPTQPPMSEHKFTYIMELQLADLWNILNGR